MSDFCSNDPELVASIKTVECSGTEAIQYETKPVKGTFHLKALTGHIIEFSLTDGTDETIALAKRIASGQYLFLGLFAKDNDSVLKAMLSKLVQLKACSAESFALFDNENSHILVAKTPALRKDKRVQEQQLKKELKNWKRLFF